jgi:hypothetical protein
MNAISDAEVVRELTAGRAAVSDYFLVDGDICSINSRGELGMMAIDDAVLAAAMVAYLRRHGAREYSSFEEFQAQQTGNGHKE